MCVFVFPRAFFSILSVMIASRCSVFVQWLDHSRKTNSAHLIAQYIIIFIWSESETKPYYITKADIFILNYSENRPKLQFKKLSIN